MKNKKILLPIVTILAAGGIAFGTVSIVNAQSKTGPFGNLAAAIAQKFNLNQTDVQSFLTNYGQTQRQTMMKTRLDKLVTAGKITSAQETAIINELSTKPKPSDFRAWLKSQNIDPNILGFFRMGVRKFEHKPTSSPTPTP